MARRGQNSSADRGSAISRASGRHKKRERRRRFGGLATGAFMVMVIWGFLIVNIISAKQDLKELQVKEAELKIEKQQQLDIKEELEQKSTYITTKAYVEDMAKKLGLVYPDEVVFKPESDD